MSAVLAEAVQSAPRIIPAIIGATFNGGMYAGIIRGVNGAPDEHLILLPGELASGNWDECMAWAAEQGGTLPTRREQALLFANLPDEFSPNWYWSREQHADYSAYAYGQVFGNGLQYWNHKSYTGSARAIRRLPIQ